MNLTDLQSVKVKKKSCVFFITAFAICISQRILHNRPIAIGYCLIYLLNRVYVESALIQSPVTGASLTVGLLVSQYVSVNMFQSIWALTYLQSQPYPPVSTARDAQHEMWASLPVTTRSMSTISVCTVHSLCVSLVKY